MGMASSQARMLNLTARMHQIEYKAAKLEAQKLQLANESDAVYDAYLEALDATKIQYGSLTGDGTITYLDASLNALENGLVSSYDGVTSYTTMFMQDKDGNLIVTPTIAAAYNLTEDGDLGTLEEYLNGFGYEMTSDAVYNVYNLSETCTYDAVNNTEGTTTVSVSGIDTEIVESYVDGRTITISSAEELAYLSTYSSVLGSYNFILTDDIEVGDDWSSIANFTGTFDGIDAQ